MMKTYLSDAIGSVGSIGSVSTGGGEGKSETQNMYALAPL
jgi:hypothetical protein